MNYLLYLLLTCLCFSQAEEILKKSDRTRTFGENNKIEILMEEFEKDQLKSSERMDVYNRGRNKSLVKLNDRKGQLVLTVDENMWIYFPKTRKPMRITPFQRLMGQASNGDIARLSYSDDYTSIILREETWKGTPCYVLELKAKSRSSTYRKIHYWVSKSEYLPLKADYFMISGKHFKSAYFEDYTVVDGSKRIGKIRFFKKDVEDQITVMRFLNIDETSLPNKFFNKNYLRKVSF